MKNVLKASTERIFCGNSIGPISFLVVVVVVFGWLVGGLFIILNNTESKFFIFCNSFVVKLMRILMSVGRLKAVELHELNDWFSFWNLFYFLEREIFVM